MAISMKPTSVGLQNTFGTQMRHAFVAIPSPETEFLGRWRSLMDVPFCMGVGGGFDVMAGKV